MAAASFDAFQRSQTSAFVTGTGIGTLGGLIGLGGAEFRLPFLISMYRFGALEAVIINKAMSLVVVMSALPFRTSTISAATIASHWFIIANLLGGSLLGAWFGASWATKLPLRHALPRHRDPAGGHGGHPHGRARRRGNRPAALRGSVADRCRAGSGFRHRRGSVVAWRGRWRASHPHLDPAVRYRREACRQSLDWRSACPR